MANVRADGGSAKPDVYARALRGVDQNTVEVGPRYRVDHLVLALTVRHERQRTVDGVQHAAGHRNQQRLHAIHHSRELQRSNAARGKSKVDRAASRDRGAAHVRHSLEDAHRMAAACEQRREQRSGETGADDRYRIVALLCGGAHLSARPSAAANSHTSANVLYSGTGAARMTSGSRQSPTKPPASRASKTLCASEGERLRRSESWQPRASGSVGVRTVSESASCARNRDSR